jgi:hypothetical protein
MDDDVGLQLVAYRHQAMQCEKGFSFFPVVDVGRAG